MSGKRIRYLLVILWAAAAACEARAASLADEQQGLYLAEPLVTEPAWIQTSAYLKTSVFDIAGAVSHPSAQAGFVIVPGFTWTLFRTVELGVSLPLVLNPDVTGDQELAEYDRQKKADPGWIAPDSFDSNPDFDMPGLVLSAKVAIWGRKPTDRFLLAAGLETNIPVFEQWATSFGRWKTDRFESSPFVLSPYAVGAITVGRFSSHLQVGAGFRMHRAADPETGMFVRDAAGQIITRKYLDLFFSMALAYALSFEGTVPMIELSGAYNPSQGLQMMITPAVTFLPGRSPASFGFACSIPVAGDDFRRTEGFRFMVLFRYQLEQLSLDLGRKAG